MGVNQQPTPRGHRLLSKRLRLKMYGERRPSTGEIDEACDQVRRSGVVPVLAARLRRRRGAESRLSLLGYETAITLHGYRKGHQMVLLDIVQLINSLGAHTLQLLRMPNWHVTGGYDRFQKLHSRVSAALDEGWDHIDADTGEITRIDRDWYRHRILHASTDMSLVSGCALAVDGTDMQTWNRLHGDVDTIDIDGEPDRDEDE